MADDLLTVLQDDHRRLEQLLVELAVLSGGEPPRRSLTDQMIIEFVRHSVIEEIFLYPAIRERLPAGDAIIGLQSQDHETVERLLEGLETAELTDAAFSRFVSRLETSVRLHIQSEEIRLFPLLVEFVPEQELLELGEKADRAMRTAPTRQPTARPLLSTVLGSGAGLGARVRGYLAELGCA